MNDKLKMAELVGLLLTDGGVSRISGSWRVHFTSTSPVLNQKFKNLVAELLNRHVTEEKRNNATIQRASINRVADKLFNFSPSFRTLGCESSPVCPRIRGKTSGSCTICKPILNKKNEKFPPTRIPKFLFHNEKAAIRFCRCAFSCDGSVILWVGKTRNGFRLQREVRLFCKHPQLLCQHKKLLEKLGFNPKSSNDTIVIRGKTELTRFFKKIGFVKGVKITRNEIWGGFEKSKLLELCVKSFEMSQIFKLKSKTKIINFLKNSLLRLETSRSNPGQGEVWRKPDGSPLPVVSCHSLG